MTAEDFIDDAEAAKLFGISRATLRHHCMKSYVCPIGKIDIRKAFPVIAGRRRVWNRNAIYALLCYPPIANTLEKE